MKDPDKGEWDRELKDYVDRGDGTIPSWVRCPGDNDSPVGPGPFDDINDIDDHTHRDEGDHTDREIFALQTLAERECQPDPPYRITYYSDAVELDESAGYRGSANEVRAPVKARYANLLSSELPSGRHAPVIDIDLPCRLVPSRTPGHWHLYIDKMMPWWRYRLLLKALVIAGVVEPGYYRASVSRRMTFVRWSLISEWHRSPNAKAIALADLLKLNEDLHR